MATEYTIDDLIAYLNKDLSPEEEVRIDQILATDPLAVETIAELEAYMESHDDVKQKFSGNQSAYLRKVAELKTPVQAKGTNRGPRLLRIAAILLLLAIPVLLLLRSPSPERLYASNFSPYEDAVTNRNATGTELKQLLQAMSYYNMGSYEQADKALEQIEAGNPEYQTARFYRSQSLMAQGKPAEAIPILESLYGLPNFALMDNVEWYLALAYLGSSQSGKAEELLTIISRTDSHYKRSEATRILNRL